MFRRGLVLVAALALITGALAPTAAAYDPVAATERISVDSSGAQRSVDSGNGVNSTDVSYDGRFVVFDTYGAFDPRDTDGQPDAYVRDRLAGTTTLLDVDGNGAVGTSFSFDPAINADGRYVAFSTLSALVPGDTNGLLDVYVRDQVDNTIVRVSVATDGAQGTTDSSGNASLSADGRFVAFGSGSRLAPTDTTSDVDTYVRDRDTDADGIFDEPGAVATVQVSVASDGTAANSGTYGRISPNGRFVALGGTATNLVAPDDPLCQRQEPDPQDPHGPSLLVQDNCADVFLHDRDADEDGIFDEAGAISTTLVSATSAGAQADNDSGDPDVSDDGDVAFWSYAANLGASQSSPSTFVRDGETGTLTFVAGGQSNGPSISNSGRYVAFDSFLSLLPGDSNNWIDAYVYDRDTATLARASVTSAGGEVPFAGFDPVLSGDGRYAEFAAISPLVADDTNGNVDVYVHDMLGTPAGAPTNVSAVPVTVQPGADGGGSTPVAITFPAVTTAGTTTLTTSQDGPQPISGFQLGDPPTYYEISTTATFTGQVTVCVSYAGVTFADENALRLQHFNISDYRWEDITTSLDTLADVICGQTSSFSPFAVFQAPFVYHFTGFFQPVDALPTYNSLKAGSAVPVKFSLGGNQGLSVFATGSPASGVISCTNAGSVDAVEQTVSASASGLTYDAGTGQYIYAWKTNKAWAGTCRQLVLKFRDGTQKAANFKFTK